jgi:predicted DNA repair protein MutK
VVGTVALLLVSGGIFAHNINYLHHFLPEWPTIIKEFIFGVLAGTVALGLVAFAQKILLLFNNKTS